MNVSAGFGSKQVSPVARHSSVVMRSGAVRITWNEFASVRVRVESAVPAWTNIAELTPGTLKRTAVGPAKLYHQLAAVLEILNVD